MDVVIEINFVSAVPPYDQIRKQIATAIRDGKLQARTKLPTVRSLAGKLEIANGTVARAYRDLEAAGYIVTNGRRGTFVTEEVPLPAPWEVENGEEKTSHRSFSASQEGESKAQESVGFAENLKEARKSGEGSNMPDLPNHLLLQLEALTASARAAGVSLESLAAFFSASPNGKKAQ
ncbi:GntR family transcriptional regulator [Actinomycetaceae bacterium TAE3-ERU4]|nr:GntR family transcriptional regulator [Actinomycetaceae bacterium TAE3-ERU4]